MHYSMGKDIICINPLGRQVIDDCSRRFACFDCQTMKWVDRSILSGREK